MSVTCIDEICDVLIFSVRLIKVKKNIYHHFLPKSSYYNNQELFYNKLT